MANIKDCRGKFAYRTAPAKKDGDMSFNLLDVNKDDIYRVARATGKNIFLIEYHVLYTCKDYILATPSIGLNEDPIIVNYNKYDDNNWELYKFEAKTIIVVNSTPFCNHTEKTIDENGNKVVKPAFVLNRREKTIHCLRCDKTLNIIKKIRIDNDNRIS